MDVPENSWEDLEKAAADRVAWRNRVQVLKKAARRSTKPVERTAATTTTHQIHSQRFNFFIPKKPTAKDKDKHKKKPKKKTLSDKAARDAHYRRLNAPAITHEKKVKFFSNHNHNDPLQSRPAPPPPSLTLPPLPTWEVAAAAVFSDSSSNSDLLGSSKFDGSNNSDADFLPNSNRLLFRQSTPTRATTTTTNNINNNTRATTATTTPATTATNNNNNSNNK